MLGMLLWSKKPDRKLPERGKAFTDFFEKQIGFTAEQSAKFQQLRDEHFENIRPYLKEVRIAKDSLFNLMRQPGVPDSVIDKAAEQLAQKEKAQELQSFRHFRKVRELCNDDQKTKFDSLMRNMINRSFSKPQNRTLQKEKPGKSFVKPG
jgi:hypothetical protein